MGPFPISFGFVYILLVVDYVSKWVEANPSLVIKASIFVADPCMPCSKSMGSCTEFPHLTTPKLMGRLRFQTGK